MLNARSLHCMQMTDERASGVALPPRCTANTIPRHHAPEFTTRYAVFECSVCTERQPDLWYIHMMLIRPRPWLPRSS